MKKFRLLQYLVLASLIMVAAPSGAATGSGVAANPTTGTPKLISATASEAVVAAGGYLFWLDTRTGGAGVYGYRSDTKRVSVLDTSAARRYALASDGTTVAWVENGDKEDVVVSYNLATGQRRGLVHGSEFGGLALAGTTLIYQDGSASHRGLYARAINNGDEHLLAARGANPVADDGLVLWSEEQIKPGSQVPTVSLHLGYLNGKGGERVLATSRGCLTGYALSRGNAYWAFGCAASDRQVYAQSISDGAATTTAISNGEGRAPYAAAGVVVWTVPPASDPAALRQWAIAAQFEGKSQVAVAPSTAEVEVKAVNKAGSIAFTVKRDPASGNHELYLSSPTETIAAFAATPAPNAPPPLCPQPTSCGQLYHNARDPYLRDGGGISKVKGVQFFIPAQGINGSTFSADYWRSVDSGEVDWWLSNASGYLLANTLRIFVDLPGDVDRSQVGDVGAIYDFAVRANARGMRIGIVMKNNADFVLDQARRDWINSLLNMFINTGNTSMIAYVSAANEINNPKFCSGRSDCYDYNYDYITNANRWVRDFAALIRSRAPILVTVGIVTDNGNGDDGLPAANDFFRRASDPSVPRLVDIVDFVSPHNYGGGGYWVYDTVRARDAHDGSYTAIVLEEYGYPTDPSSMDEYHNEGNEICREHPEDPICDKTAVHYVENNTKSMRERDYAGGVAWMLADISGGNCASPDDLFTGLFSVSRTYCGGTHTAPGEPKTTSFRVRNHHYYY